MRPMESKKYKKTELNEEKHAFLGQQTCLLDGQLGAIFPARAYLQNSSTFRDLLKWQNPVSALDFAKIE